MNLTSGKFTAPRDGMYSFSCTGRAYLPGSSSTVYFSVVMYCNGNSIGNVMDVVKKGSADDVGGGQYETFSLQLTRNLKKGDKIWLEIYHMSTGAYLYCFYDTHFSGSLLEEKIKIA